ncbi:MAG: molecular chaperone HtpG [Bacillota bacterium]|nr:molecular chaperone HtpG [Bacillota bacterium]
MTKKTGMLTVNSENIFPIIKKWLYTEQDIFVRELISNGADAIYKLAKVCDGEKTKQEGKIELEINLQENTLKFIDNGLGMDAEEVDRYINQIAFSGATDFFNKYKDSENRQKVIGHFGLGFYSAFMPAERVTINTLSHRLDSAPVYWDCSADMNYDMSVGTRDRAGTEITLYLADGSQYLDPEYLEKTVKKYFEFFAIPILITCNEAADDKSPAYGTKMVNDTNPLWCRNPEDCERQEYIDFYKKAFRVEVEPKLWVHLHSEDLGVKGIIYFRNQAQMEKSIDGTMKLYSQQVFISDQAKTLIPEYLFLQDGIIDCADAPLMVSRSALQEDENVVDITAYITEQVAYKLYGTFECEREFYESIWEDLNPFVKFSCLKDKLLASYVEKFIIFKNLNGTYVTLKEHLEQIEPFHKNVVYYVSDDIQQANYINIFKKAGIDALLMTHVVDQPYIKKQEIKNQELRFNSIDSDFYEALKAEEAGSADEVRAEADENSFIENALKDTFAEILKGRQIEVKVGKLITPEVSSVIIIDEEERRVRETLEIYEARGIDTSGFKTGNDTLLLNTASPLVQYMAHEASEDEKSLLGRQLYDLGRLGQESLEAQEMADFIERSNLILQMLIQR